VEHAWREEELKKLYNKWELVTIEKREKLDTFYGKKYKRRMWWMLLQNK
jgi:hypothetical protein